MSTFGSLGLTDIFIYVSAFYVAQAIFKNDFKIYKLCVPGVGMCTCVRVLDPLELEVQEEVEHLIRVQGTNPGPLEERTALLMASPPLQLTHPVGISSVTSPKIYKPWDY